MTEVSRFRLLQPRKSYIHNVYAESRVYLKKAGTDRSTFYSDGTDSDGVFYPGMDDSETYERTGIVNSEAGKETYPETLGSVHEVL